MPPGAEPGTAPKVAPGTILELSARSIAFGGQAVARLDGFVFFVTGALPGERVRARVQQIRRQYGVAETIEVLCPSPDRISPPCPVFHRCGGCAFLHWRYKAQCAAKTQWVRDALRRFPDIARAVPEIEPADPPWGFRNRMGFSISLDTGKQVILGLHERGSRTRRVPADACLLPAREIMEACASLRAFLQGKTVLPRRADVRFSRYTGQCMADLHTDRPLPYTAQLADAMRSVFDHLFVSVGPDGPGHRVRRRRERVLGAEPFLEQIGGREFEIGPDTFFQTHTAQADTLVRYIRAMANRNGARHILDLYAGVGAIALTLATADRNVMGLEAWKPAVEAARKNAARNGIDTVQFRPASVESLQPEIFGRVPDLVVVDPPREGLSPAARRSVPAVAAPRLVYVSCNPATLTRDLDALVGCGYRVVSARGFDLFPQTPHVECVVELHHGPGCPPGQAE